jgi:hypothetical protein
MWYYIYMKTEIFQSNAESAPLPREKKIKFARIVLERMVKKYDVSMTERPQGDIKFAKSKAVIFTESLDTNPKQNTQAIGIFFVGDDNNTREAAFVADNLGLYPIINYDPTGKKVDSRNTKKPFPVDRSQNFASEKAIRDHVKAIEKLPQTLKFINEEDIPQFAITSYEKPDSK